MPLDGSFALPGPFQVSRFRETTLNWDFFLGSFCAFLLSCCSHLGETWPSSLHHSTERRIICFDRRYRYNNLLIPSSFLHIVIIDFFDQRHSWILCPELCHRVHTKRFTQNVMNLKTVCWLAVQKSKKIMIYEVPFNHHQGRRHHCHRCLREERRTRVLFTMTTWGDRWSS